MFCYAKCAILKKMISKMLNGTSAISMTAERDEENDDGHIFLIKCNGRAVGGFGGKVAQTLASALDAGQLALVGGNRAPSWSEADFDVFHNGADEEGAREWKRRLDAVDQSFEADVWAKERVCSSGNCDCC